MQDTPYLQVKRVWQGAEGSPCDRLTLVVPVDMSVKTGMKSRIFYGKTG
jgi:hypothetical protein